MSTVKENKDNILADRTVEQIRTEEEKANTMSTQESQNQSQEWSRSNTESTSVNAPKQY